MDTKTQNPLDEIPNDILKKQIITYFELQKIRTDLNPEPRPLTLTGLALALGVTLKDILLYPASGLHANLISKAKGECEADLVDRMYSKKIDRATGMLLLKNHFGYLDIAKALTDEERKKRKIADKLAGKRTISEILDDIEKRNQ